MKGILIALITSVAVAAGGVVALNKKGINLPFLSSLRLGGIQAPQLAVNSSQPINSGTSAGEVMGIETTATPSVGDKLAAVTGAIGSIASSIGQSAVRTGQTLVNNVSSTPSSDRDVIDMASVVSQITSQVESIPSNLVNQAKVEYCRQVLQAATASGTKSN